MVNRENLDKKIGEGARIVVLGVVFLVTISAFLLVLFSEGEGLESCTNIGVVEGDNCYGGAVPLLSPPDPKDKTVSLIVLLLVNIFLLVFLIRLAIRLQRGKKRVLKKRKRKN